MASIQNYASGVTVGAAVLQAGDASRVAPTAFATVFTPTTTGLAGGANNGGQVERITVAPIGNTTATALRLFRWDGTTAHLYNEVPISALTVSGSTANAAFPLEAVDNSNLFPILIPPGWTLRATLNDTQLVQETAIANIAAAQTTAGAANLLLNGSSVTAGSAAAIVIAVAPTSGTPLTLTASPYVATLPALVSITSASNVSTVGHKIFGRSPAGALISETLVGPNIGTVYSVNVYKAVFAIIPNSTSGNTASVGYSAVAGTAVLPLPAQVMLTSGASLSGINFTITGMTGAGSVVSEVLAGPNAGAVLSANSYAAVFTIATSAASGSVQVGTQAILGGVKISAEGGSY